MKMLRTLLPIGLVLSSWFAQAQNPDLVTPPQGPGTKSLNGPDAIQFIQLQKRLETGQQSALKMVSFMKAAPSVKQWAVPPAGILPYDYDPDHGFLWYVNDNEAAATSVGARKIALGGALGYKYTGHKDSVLTHIGLAEIGRPRDTHREYGGRVTQVTTGLALDNHASHVAGTLVASGVDAAAKGVAFKASIRAYSANEAFTRMASDNQVWISNHSYGPASGMRWNPTLTRYEWYGTHNANKDWKMGAYTADAATADALARTYPAYVIVKSAGNNHGQAGGVMPANYVVQNPGWVPGVGAKDLCTGYDNLSGFASAKNVISVANCSTAAAAAYVDETSVVLHPSSSWGPTDDGRIKPDITAPGSDLYSCSSTADNAYHNDRGTSMATPVVTGTATLLMEAWYKYFRYYPIASMIKALMLHTAREAGDDQGPDYKHGWGLLDAEQAMAVLRNKDQKHLTITHLLQPGTTYNIKVRARGTGHLWATMVWTDLAGTAVPNGTLDNNTRKLVNDLDLRITQMVGGAVTLPWTLDPANPANPATRADNNRDNVEQVEIDNPVAEHYYMITVTHKGALAAAQEFSLCVTGIMPTAVWVGKSPNGPLATNWMNWSDGYVPDSTKDIVIPIGYQGVVLNQPGGARRLEIAHGAVATIGVPKFVIKHDLYSWSHAWHTLTGGTLIFRGGSTQNIVGNFDLKNLIIDNPTDVIIGKGSTIKMQGLLNVIRGKLDIGQGKLVMIPVPTLRTVTVNLPDFGIGPAPVARVPIHQTSSVAPLLNGASIVGNVEVHRSFSPVNGTGFWTSMGPVVQGRKLINYDTAFRFAGFGGRPGNSTAYFFNPSSVPNTGWVKPGSLQDPLNPATGLLVWFNSTAISGLIPLAIEKGPLTQGQVVKNLLFCGQNCATWQGGPVGTNGFNMVSNPYLCAIDFNRVQKNQVQPWFSVWDKGMYRYYANGVGTLGQGQIIGPGQGFWVIASAAGASLTFKETDKVIDTLMPGFRMAAPDLLRIQLRDSSQVADESIVFFDGTSAPLLEVPKQLNHNHNVYTVRGGRQLAMEQRTPIGHQEDTIWVEMQSRSTGRYVLKLADMASIPPNSLVKWRTPGAPYFNPISGTDSLIISLSARVPVQIPIVIGASITTKLSPSDQERISIWPNPTHDVLHISSLQPEHLSTWNLTDMTGKTVASSITAAVKHEISTTEIPAGTYLLHWKSTVHNLSHGVQRILIQK